MKRIIGSRLNLVAVWVAGIATAFVALSVTMVWAQSDPLVVKTGGGQVRGVARNGGGAKFLGIPFAQPPVGELRWRDPVPPVAWSGVRDATSYSKPCAQPDLGGWNRHDAETGVEDCLYLNVVVPEWPVKKPLPVMFWIHGGANEGGTAMSPLYTDGTLTNHGVILVTVNYRLGVFGFLAHPELTNESAHHGSGNYGLMDQILALKWVIANIAQFGGDAKNITVFGQSAGAVDTGMLMVSSAKGLFEKAIQESGAAFTQTATTLAEAEDQGNKFAVAMGAPEGTGQIAYLRGIAAGELIKKWAAHELRPRFGPDVDGWVLTRNPAVVFSAGEESPIPLLFGTTTREFGSAESSDELRATVMKVSGAVAPQVLKAYGLADGGTGTSDPVYGTAADQFAADSMFRYPATTEGRWHESAHHATYQYEFNHAVPGQPAAIHSTELGFVFGFYPKVGNLAGPYSDTDSKISDMVESYFTNFAKTGNPNGAGLPNWPEFGSTATYVQITQDGQIVAASDLRGLVCKVYRDVIETKIKPGK
ncbi:MAG: carboxylesterase family protein [Terracidiphilus sp.]|jgi:para-nitrobenzyl esterase